ncbi:hypothetical protein AAY55_17060 [Vibrio metoecus]|uniref:Uncharacterized protein n=2 Tax=Vibrio metoecus TaxID=1481663 RepID=A0A0Q0KFY8_VIBMT|nr:hypothetical protein AAY55_17060 [Vibrio metoecus]
MRCQPLRRALSVSVVQRKKLNICFTISDVDWQITKDIFGIAASIATVLGGFAACFAAYFAYSGVSTWQKSIRLQKRYDYIEPMHIALDGMLEKRFAFRSSVAKYSEDKINYREFSENVSAFTQYQSDLKRYSSLLKHELSSSERKQLDRYFAKVNDGFNDFLGTKPVEVGSFDKRLESFNGKHFVSAVQEYKGYLNSLK